MQFYGQTIKILEDSGQWPHKAKPEFIAASLGKGKQRVPGGNDAVRKWVEKLSKGGLNSVVRGIIDKDVGNVKSKGVFILERYSFENYLVDPLVVYAAALDAGLETPITLDPPIRADRVYQIGERSEEELQELVNAVADLLRSGLKPEPEGGELRMQAVQYSNGKRVLMPNWLLERRGHDLLHRVRGPWPRLTREELLRAYNRVRLVPTCLAHVLERCVLPLDPA